MRCVIKYILKTRYKFKKFYEVCAQRNVVYDVELNTINVKSKNKICYGKHVKYNIRKNVFERN